MSKSQVGACLDRRARDILIIIGVTVASVIVGGCGSSGQTCEGPVCNSYVRVEVEDDKPDVEGAELETGAWTFVVRGDGREMSRCSVDLPTDGISIDCENSNDGYEGYLESNDRQISGITLRFKDKSAMPEDVSVEVKRQGDVVHSASWALTYQTERGDDCSETCRSSTVELDASNL